MLRKLAAALVATTLIAGPAFAQSTGNSGTMPPAPAAQTAPAASTATTPAAKPAVKATAKTAKTVKHSVKHAHKHAARHTKKGAAMHQTRHVKSTKKHQAGVAAAAKRS